MKSTRFAKRVALSLLAVLLVLGIFGALVMLLWNALIPELFQGPMLNYWQAVGLLLLSHILLRGITTHGLRGRRHARRRRKWKERLASMTPEERAALESELDVQRSSTTREVDD
jgi:hypothetical protein